MCRQLTKVVASMNNGKIPKKMRKQLGLSSPQHEHENVLRTIPGLVGTSDGRVIEKSLLLFRTDGSSRFWISDNPSRAEQHHQPR
jgi:hypothetical protein